MMPIDLVGPIGLVPKELQTTAKSPSNQAQVSSLIILPAGMKGFGLPSASVCQVPTKYPSRLCSGPGFGGPAGAWARAIPEDRASSVAVRRSVLVMVHLHIATQSSTEGKASPAHHRYGTTSLVLSEGTSLARRPPRRDE